MGASSTTPPAVTTGYRVEAGSRSTRETGAMPELVLPTTVRPRVLPGGDGRVRRRGRGASQTAAWIEHNAPGWKDPDAFAAFVRR